MQDIRIAKGVMRKYWIIAVYRRIDMKLTITSILELHLKRLIGIRCARG